MLPICPEWILGRMERETGFEPATSTLARLHSTTELFPLSLKAAEGYYPNRAQNSTTDCTDSIDLKRISEEGDFLPKNRDNIEPISILTKVVVGDEVLGRPA